MRRAAGGDRAVWRWIVEAHLPAMHGLAYRMSLQDSAAEDVAQEAFLRLWKVASRWKPEARIATWLYRVVRNLTIDTIRRRKTNAAEELGEDFESDVPTPLEILSAERVERKLQKRSGSSPSASALPSCWCISANAAASRQGTL